jgi:hypothetical protein
MSCHTDRVPLLNKMMPKRNFWSLLSSLIVHNKRAREVQSRLWAGTLAKPQGLCLRRTRKAQPWRTRARFLCIGWPLAGRGFQCRDSAS